MEKILRDIAKILDFSDSFFEEVESTYPQYQHDC